MSNLSVIAGKSSEELAKKISKKINANLVKSEVRIFADGESKTTLNGMSLKIECHSKWSVTQNGMSLKIECH